MTGTEAAACWCREPGRRRYIHGPWCARIRELEAELAEWKLHAPYSWAFEAWKKAEAEVERLKAVIAKHSGSKGHWDEAFVKERGGRESGGGEPIPERARTNPNAAANPAARKEARP